MSEAEVASHEILTRQLVTLLGFDDGADDVLDHLLTVESREDLLDYLSQLLGGVNDDTKSFVDNVGRFQRGEEVEFEAPAEEVKKAVVVTKPPAPVPEKVPTKPITTARVPKSQPMKATAKKFAPAKTAPKPKAQPEGAVSKLASLSSSSSTAKQKSAQATPDKSTAADTNKPQPAQKGKPKIECGCFGNLHKALANCLHCGRVSCQKEGYDFCPFCTNLVLPVVPPEEGMNEAWARKERLLQYERESAERTVVLDDQADHFSSQDSAWLTEDERADAKERSDARSHEMSHRKKVQLSINI